MKAESAIVIVHGAFGGGWEWSEVADYLRGLGHVVFAPTLTGMGERSHLGPRVGMETHVRDVLAVLEFEDLHDVVLCGASYGGMAVSGAADRAQDRVSLVIYIDALIPRDGQSGLDLTPERFRDLILSAADEQGHGWVDVPSDILPPEGIIPEHIRARYIARLRPQPVATFTEPLRLGGAIESTNRAFVRCTKGNLDIGGDPIAPMAARARAEGWPYREFPAPHDPHLFDPSGIATVLHELASAYRSRATDVGS